MICPLQHIVTNVMLSILPINLQGHFRNVRSVGRLMGLDLNLLLNNPLQHIAKSAIPNSKLIHPVDHLKNVLVAVNSTVSDSKNRPLKLQAAPNAILFIKHILLMAHSKNARIVANLTALDLNDHLGKDILLPLVS